MLDRAFGEDVMDVMDVILSSRAVSLRTLSASWLIHVTVSRPEISDILQGAEYEPVFIPGSWQEAGVSSWL